MMNSANAGTSMCHGNFTYWAGWYDENGKYHHIRGYISKSGLWQDMKDMGATPAQIKEAKTAMKNAPTKKMYK